MSRDGKGVEPASSSVSGASSFSPSTEARDPIAALLRGQWIDPATRAPTALPIGAIASESTLRGTEADRVASLDLGRRLAVVSDATTHRVLGERIERALASLGAVDSVMLATDCQPDRETVERVRAASAAADGLIAVGSGTINDLAKFAASIDRKPFAVFPTAPSMNGYTSANAAITVDGHKKTLPAALARGVFIDLEVMSSAPARMIRAGLGDSLCRPTAQVDWLLSNRLLGTPYKRLPFELLADDEGTLLDAPEALLAGDADAMRALARTLVLSGIGMTLCGGSYPASQGEHLVSHYIDMFAPADRPHYLHGEQVAVATLTMARLQQAMLDGPAPVLQASSATAEALARRFGADVGAACWKEFRPKRLDSASAARLTERAREAWDGLRHDAARATISASVLEDVMRRAGGPTRATDIGVDRSFYADAVRYARFLRERFTFLDLASDAGMSIDAFVS